MRSEFDKELHTMHKELMGMGASCERAIALAASSMGGNTPIGGFLVSVLFGIAQAVANVMQLTTIPTEMIQMLPYLTTLVGLGIYSYSRMKKRQRLAGK